MSGAVVMVMWCFLIQLLSKCKKDGCAAPVLPDNMTARRNGERQNFIIYFWSRIFASLKGPYHRLL